MKSKLVSPMTSTASTQTTFRRLSKLSIIFTAVVLTAMIVAAFIARRFDLIIIVAAVMLLLSVMEYFGDRIVVDGDELTVYETFKPIRVPISKIERIEFWGKLGLRIYLSDPAVLNSHSPLMMTLTDRQGLIDSLRLRRPSITVSIPRSVAH